MTKKRIMLVEDELITARDIRTTLEGLGYEVPVVVSSGTDAIRMADEFRPDIILMDITLDGAMTGIEAAEQIWISQQIPIIFLTAHQDNDTIEQAITAEPFGYLIKPCTQNSLKNSIEVALYKSEADTRVRESEQRYRTLVEQAPVAITVHSGGSFIYCNPAAVNFFGATSETELLDRPILDVVHPDSRAQVWERIATALATGQPKTAEVERYMRLDGIDVIAEVVDIPTTYQGKPAVQEVLRDITAQTQAKEKILRLNEEIERRVRERTSELKRLNRELEEFCYSISHEFRAPLARLEGFSRMITEAANESDMAEVVHSADRIEVASQKLRTVIDSLLTLNRLSRADIVLSPVNLSKISMQIVAELQEQNDTRIITIKIAPDIVVRGDRHMLEICMRNLLGNAFKHTSKTVEASIEFGKLPHEGGDVYFVKDNGVGFDMEYVKNLFVPFCRLHNESEFEGSGIGLATVQRIIEKHNGQIWPEAVPGKGATFYFTLNWGTP